jgi:hypothetical protein
MLTSITGGARRAFQRLPVAARIAILGGVIALAVPVILKIKEASNRVEGQNNLHQSRAEMHSHQDAYDGLSSNVSGGMVLGGWRREDSEAASSRAIRSEGVGEDGIEPPTLANKYHGLFNYNVNASLGRKIKTTAEIVLIVNDFEKAEQSLRGLVKSQGGYTARADVTGATGSPRSGRWRVRLPADHVESFIDGTRRLGVPQTSGLESEDVTAEFVDLEARLKNKTMQETTLRGYLTDKKAKSELKDILAVEQELARVRGEIKQMEGQRRLLNNLTSLATISVVMQEVKDYVPPETPTFASTISKTFVESIELLVGCVKQIVIAIVAAAPWLFVIAAAIIPCWFIMSRRHVRPAAPQSTA